VSVPYFVREAHRGAVFCTLEWAWGDFVGWYRDSWQTAAAADTVPRSSPSAASARRHRLRLSDTRAAGGVASPLSG